MNSVIIFSIIFLIGCSSNKSRKEHQLATEMNAFLTSGIYDVQVVEPYVADTLSKVVKGQVSLTNNLGLIKFDGMDTFSELDSIKVSLSDSTLMRNYSINHFIDTISVSSDRSGIGEAYFGYAFGDESSGGIASIPEFEHFFETDNRSKVQALFIIGRTRKDEIVIRRMEKVVSSGEVLMDINKVFILSRKRFL